MLNKKRIFVPITKVDEVKKEVWGVLAEEVADKSGEIFDYASSVPYFKEWNAQFAKATGDQSVGNLRAMHGKVAAGKFIEMNYDDAAKQVLVGAKVVDDNEWQKVAEGVYTGFSIGGKYVKTWQDGNLTRYTAAPAEGSLVDNPCMYGATFSAVKSDGASEMRKFVGSESTRKLSKSMYGVSDTASVVDSLRYVYQYLKSEAEWEGDNSLIPGRIKKVLKELASILVDMAQEEASELLAEIEQLDNEENIKMAKAEELTLEGLGKKFETLQASFDSFVKSVTKAAEPSEDEKKKKAEEEAEKAAAAEKEKAKEKDKDGACGDGATKSAEGDLNKAAAVEMEKKFDSRFSTVEKGLETVTSALGNITEAFQKFLEQPAPSKVVANAAVANVVTKSQDGADLNKSATEQARPEDVVKAIHAGGPILVAARK